MSFPLRFPSLFSAAIAVTSSGPIVAETVPTFSADIAEIIYQHCTVCHHDGGSAPFSLTTYAAIKRRSRQISEVVADRFMPPWKPDAHYGPPLQGNRQLAAQEIDSIIRWHAAGAPAGDLNQAPDPPEPSSEWTLGPPDLILELPQSYELSAEGQDVFRNFVIPVPLVETTYIRAIEFQPRASQIIHHAGIMTDQTGRARERDAHDTTPGFPSMDLGDFGNPDGHIIGWTPGQVPYETYPGTAWKLEPGTDLVVQLHLLPRGKPATVAPRLGLYFSDTPPTRTTTVVQLRELSIDIPAGESNYQVEESIVLPAPTRVLRIFPHAHYLGKNIEVFAELPSGQRQPLLQISDWDFNWQSDYTFTDPVYLPAQSRLVMHITYDNSAANIRNPSSPPQPVQWGWKSTDEMGGIVVQLLLDEANDLPQIHENVARYEIDRLGAAPVLLHSLADALIKQNRAPEAEPLLQQIIAVEPTYAAAYRELANLLISRGEWAAATPHLHEYLTLHPDNGTARLSLGACLLRQGQIPAAMTVLEAGLHWLSHDPNYLEGLGNAYLETGDSAHALPHFEAAIALLTSESDAQLAASLWFKLAYLHLGRGDRAVAESATLRAVALAPDHLGAGTLATFLALEVNELELARDRLQDLVAHAKIDAIALRNIAQRLPFPNGPIMFAQVLAQSGQVPAAITVLSRAADQAAAASDFQLETDLKALITGLRTL